MQKLTDINQAEATIRIAAYKNIKELAVFMQKTFCDTFGYLFPKKILIQHMKCCLSIEHISSSLEKIHNRFLLAYSDNQLVGYAKIKFYSCQPVLPQAKQMQLQLLYVDNAFIGKGIGAELMNRCIELAKEEGFPVIWLSTLNSNYRAIDFFKKFGFKKAGEHVFKTHDLVFHNDLMKLKTYQ